MSEAVKCGLHVGRGSMVSCGCFMVFARKGHRASDARPGPPGSSLGVCVPALLLVARPAAAQFTPFPTTSRNILEGNWQSCRESDGQYAERVYDHVVNGVGQFEVHMGPRREFAIFKGVQDAHRDHESPENLLKPFRVPIDGRPRKAAMGNSLAEPGVHRDAGRRIAHRLRELVHPARAAREDVALNR